MKKYWKLITGIVTAILIAITAHRIQGLKRSAERQTEKAADKLNSGISSDIAKGKKMTEAANVKIDKGIALEAKLETQLETLSENDSIDKVANNFNSRRVRINPGSTDT